MDLLRKISETSSLSRRQLLRTFSSTAATGLLLSPVSASSQEVFPRQTVRIVVPFPAGGTADVLPRIVAEKLAVRWKQAVVVENRAGANGNIGADTVYRSTADGHTMLWSPPGPLAINGSLYKTVAYDSTKFVPITVLASESNALGARRDAPFGTLQELIRYAKENSGKVTVASSGPGSTSHLTAVMFQNATGTSLTHVPYRGALPAIADMMAGQVDLFFGSMGSMLSFAAASKMKILAVTDDRRHDSLPAVPTIAQSGYPGFQSSTWFGVVAPPKTPDAVAQQISQAINEVLKMPDVIQRFTAQGATPVGGTPEDAERFIRSEAAHWRKVIADGRVTVE